MNEYYSESVIEQSLQSVLTAHNLSADLEMSRSGTYRVVQAHDNAHDIANDTHGAKYIIKVLRKQNSQAIQEFAKEAAIIQYFSTDTYCPLATPEHVYIYNEDLPHSDAVTATPPVLAYTLVEGSSLGWYYFYVSTIKDLTRIGATELIHALTYVQSQTKNLSSIIAPKSETDLLQSVQMTHDAALLGGLAESQYATCYNIASQVIPTWLQNPVIVHGDFNPKNIIVTPQNTVGFIDWSDAYLGGAYMDLAFFWLTCWRQPDFQDQLVQNIQQPTEFWQAVCFWLPKFHALLHDVEQALHTEFEQGEIPLEAKVDNLNYVQQAKDFYAPRIKSFLELAGH